MARKSGKRKYKNALFLAGVLLLVLTLLFVTDLDKPVTDWLEANNMNSFVVAGVLIFIAVILIHLSGHSAKKRLVEGFFGNPKDYKKA